MNVTQIAQKSKVPVQSSNTPLPPTVLGLFFGVFLQAFGSRSLANTILSEWLESDQPVAPEFWCWSESR